MTPTRPDTVDVAIIGAGPVGLSLANLLGRLGRSVIVLEKESAGYALPRAVTFDDEVMRIFQAMGLEDEVGEVTEVGGDAQFVDGEGRVLVHWKRPRELTPNGWYVNYRFHQPTLERVLRDGLDRFDRVGLSWDSEVVDLVADDLGVDVHCSNAKTLRANYVVGCDGGRSFTRKWIGSGAEDLGFHEEWLIVDLLAHAGQVEPDDKTTHYCGTARMGSKVYVGQARRRWEFRLNPDDDAKTIGEAENTWPILSAWITPDQAEIERTAVYTFHSLIAQNWRKGRVMIAGDAAHQTPPFMGQGMCAGIRDCANLAWKLDRALSDKGPAGLLDTYETERKPHARAFIELTMNMGQVINKTAGRLHDVADDQPDGKQEMQLIRPILGPGLAVGDATLRGSLFPQVTLSDGVRLDERVGLNPALLCASPVDPGLTADFQAAGVEVVSDPVLAGDLNGKGVLMRPDRAILGAAEDVAALAPDHWFVQ